MLSHTSKFKTVFANIIYLYAKRRTLCIFEITLSLLISLFYQTLQLMHFDYAPLHAVQLRKVPTTGTIFMVYG